jgi:hypothetical protein
LTGDAGLPIGGFAFERAEGSACFGDSRPGFLGAGEVGDDTSGRDWYLTLMQGITFRHPKAAGLFSGRGGITRQLCLRDMGDEAKRERHSEQCVNQWPNVQPHSRWAPLESRMVTQP